MKNALIKDTTREIRNSLSRFLSIFAIILLGCGFFAGVKATMPDMKETAEVYFDENNLMDLRLVSTIGVKAEDIAAVKKLDCVEGVMAGYSKDVFFNDNGKNVALKIMSYNDILARDDKDNLNRPVLIEGRMPEKPGECVVDQKLKSDSYKIGSTLELVSAESDKEITDTLSTDSYTVVGVVTSPLYIGHERDRTNIGSGTVSGFVLIPETEFVADYYTELFVTLKDCDYKPFSDEYSEAVDKVKNEIEQAFSESVNERYSDIVNLNNSKLESAKTSIQTLEEILAYDTEQLIELKAQTEKAVSDLEIQAQTDSSALLKGKLSKTKSKLSQISLLIEARQQEDAETLGNFYYELESAKAEIEAAEAELSEFKDPKTFSYTRYASTDYGGFSGDSEKIDSIAKVFPVFFIIVAALVCLTTMTRMVEEQRIQIGTYKALGYSSVKIASKYLVYAIVASVSGSLIGTAIGLQIFPRIIYSCYKILYNIPEIITPFKPLYAAGCVIVSVLCTCSAVIFSCYKELSSQPSQLMRPKAPKSGKRVFLEKIPFVWKRLDFLAKVTVRNLLRYKKRFMMTLVGVAGCTALILTGFALKHSISAILNLQFEKVFKYDGLASLNTADFSLDECFSEVSENKNVTEAMKIYQKVGKIKCDNEFQEVYLVVPENADEISSYVNLCERTTGKPIKLDDNGAVITEKLSKLLDVKQGDTIEIDLEEDGKITFEISAVTENYAMHYAYVSPELYESLLRKPDYNMCFFNLDDNAERTEIAETLISGKKVLGITYLEDNGKNFRDSLKSLDAIVWLLIICAGALAMVVLYNLANINITERIREIATIKVLGFYDGEASAYIYRENIISAIIGIIFGWGFGIVLHRFVVLTSEVDIVMFDRSVVWWAYLFSAVLTMAFTAVINVILHFKLKKVDMVESLKSVE